jgi:hypothetical protein
VSQASDVLGEVKQLVADVSKDVKAFESEFGEFTDLAHVNIARIHLTELRGVLDSRSLNAMVDPVAEAAAYQEFLDARTPAGFVPQPSAPERSMAPVVEGDMAPVVVAGAAGATPASAAAVPAEAAGPGPETSAGSGALTDLIESAP